MLEFRNFRQTLFKYFYGFIFMYFQNINKISANKFKITFGIDSFMLATMESLPTDLLM